MRFYSVVQLGPNRELTKQGFLLCKNVGIARTGKQVYGPGQTPLEVGPDGTVIIDREASEVFRAETVASGNGSTFVVWFHTGKLSHPVDQEGATEFVVPDNWKEYAAGFVFNVHRGSGKDSDLLLADILVTDAEAIRLIVEEGFDEVSAGYDAEYEEDGPGKGRQVKILGNHVALVESGRAGPRCAVQDSISGGKMATIKVKGWAGIKGSMAKHLRKAFPTIDADEIDKAVDAVEDEPEERKEAVAADRRTADQKARDAEEDAEYAKKVADRKTRDAGEPVEKEGETHIHIHTEPEPVEPVVTADEDEDFEALKKAHEELQGKHDALEARVADSEDRLTACEARLPAEKTADETEAEEKAKEEDETIDELEEEAPEGTGDEAVKEAVKTGDSAFMEDSFQATRSNAEILAPGVTFPVFDSKAAPKSTLNQLTSFRKKVLGIAASTIDSAATIAELRSGRPLTQGALDRMSPGETRTLFAGAALAVKQLNSTSTRRTADSTAAPVVKTTKQINDEFWASH
jgi:hypothetical protein